jgi:hypothetical protein
MVPENDSSRAAVGGSGRVRTTGFAHFFGFERAEGTSSTTCAMLAWDSFGNGSGRFASLFTVCVWLLSALFHGKIPMMAFVKENFIVRRDE